MPREVTKEPWKVIAEILTGNDPERLDEYLDSLTPSDVARAISRLDEDAQARLLTLLEPHDAADLLEELSDEQGADILEDLPAHRAAAIVEHMTSDERADVLGELDHEDAEAILSKMDPEEAEDARHLLTYPADTAGGIMVTEFLAYPMTMKISELVADMHQNAKEYADYLVQYVYAVNESGTLIGVVPLRDLVLSREDDKLASIMIPNPLYVFTDTPLDEISQIFDRYVFVGIPVVDDSGRMVGVVRRSDAEQALGERADRALLQFSGIIGGYELRSMPVLTRSSRRMTWLALNMLLTFGSASVILHFEHSIGVLTTLAFFLPIIGNMSGCTGNQAMGVSIRELTLGLIKPEDAARVFFKEIQVGLLNGLLLGIMLSAIAIALQKGPAMGIIAGVALALNSVLAISLGALVPLFLRKLRIDPALSAPPIITTVSDMCGFLIFLSLATWLLL